MAETKARFLANLIGANNTANDFTLPNVAISGTSGKVLTSDGEGGVTWETTELAPETTSISPNEVESGDDQTTGGNQTFTLTGTNYATSGMTVTFLANSGSNITSGITVTHGTATSFTVTIARSAFVNANEPYSIKVTKSTGLSHTLADALRVDNAPSFSTYVGTLTGSPPVVASVQDNETASEITARNIAISATDAEGDTVTYSETTNTLTNAGMTLSSAGAITGTPTAVSSDTNYTFTARATSTGDGGATTKATDQQFVFTITNFVPQLFAGKAYTGNSSSSQAITFDETNDFQPDLVWIKNRGSEHHRLFDSVRTPTGGSIRSSQTNAANYSGSDLVFGYLSAFGTDGFTVNDGSTNANGTKTDGTNYINWSWKAGGAPSAELKKMTDGTETNLSAPSGTSTIKQSVNTIGGFSITTFTGNNSSDKAIPHGLGAIPDLVIIKRTNGAWNWPVWNKHMNSGAVGEGEYLLLNKDDKKGHVGNNQNNTEHFEAVSSSAVTVASSDEAGASGGSYVMYCWKAMTNLSAFGNFTWSVDGDYTVSGLSFQPRYVMIKCTGAQSGWNIWDSFRGFGDTADYFKANESSAENTGDPDKGCVVTSNSFTVGSTLRENTNWIYMAFA